MTVDDVFVPVVDAVVPVIDCVSEFVAVFVGELAEGRVGEPEPGLLSVCVSSASSARSSFNEVSSFNDGSIPCTSSALT